MRPPKPGWWPGASGWRRLPPSPRALRGRGVAVTLLYGARSGGELFYLDWFRARGVRVVLATEDGSAGDHGRVTVPLERELREAAGNPQSSGRDIMIYACGPEPMLEAVAHAATRHGRPSQVSVERVMGCGLGGCYSCVIPMRNGRNGRHYVRSCIGGPVFSGADIVWGEQEEPKAQENQAKTIA